MAEKQGQAHAPTRHIEALKSLQTSAASQATALISDLQAKIPSDQCKTLHWYSAQAAFVIRRHTTVLMSKWDQEDYLGHPHQI